MARFSAASSKLRWFTPATIALGFAAIFESLCMAQVAARLAPVPPGPLELASAGVHTVDTPEERAQLVRLMDRAREYYTLTNAEVPFHLKTSFVVSSNGETKLDGAWQMEETFAPKLGRLLTAETADYSLRQLRVSKMLYQSPSGAIPLRLHEAIAHLLGPMEPSPKTELDLIRRVQSNLNGVAVTCVLLANAQLAGQANSPGRFWQEREECIDPQTGHLVLHSPVPGLTVLYDFADALRFHGKELPRKMTVVENGATVIAEQVESLDDLPTVDASMFTPEPPMQPQGTVIAGRITMTIGVKPGAAPLQTAVIFGLLNPDGTITEAHPLQSSDPSFVEAALARVRKTRHPIPVAPGANPEQHEYFAVMRFNPED